MRLLLNISILFTIGCCSSGTTTIEKRPDRCLLYKTGRQAYPKHDPHKTRIDPALAWNKEYMSGGYNLLELERHYIKCKVRVK